MNYEPSVLKCDLCTLSNFYPAKFKYYSAGAKQRLKLVEPTNIKLDYMFKDSFCLLKKRL